MRASNRGLCERDGFDGGVQRWVKQHVRHSMIEPTSHLSVRKLVAEEEEMLRRQQGAEQSL